MLSPSNLPHPDNIVCVSSEKRLAICWPCQWDAIGGAQLAACSNDILSKFVHNRLSFQILKDWKKIQESQVYRSTEKFIENE